MSEFAVSRRGFIQSAMAIGGIAAAQTLLTIEPASAASPAKIRMQLGWLASNGLLGEVVAMKKGYYTEQGPAGDCSRWPER